MLVRALPKDTAAQTIARQSACSGMSSGANIEEAQNARSRLDFASRPKIVRAEASAAFYWLRLIAARDMLPERRMAAILQESEELIRTLMSIVRKVKKRGAQSEFPNS